MKRHRFLFTIAAILSALLFYGCGKNEGFYVEQSEEAANPAEIAEESGMDINDTNGIREEIEENREPADIFVQVCGSVNNPGVYSLKAGSRIFEAVEMAGGLKEDADLVMVNQAQVLEDGQMVYVYAKGEADGPSPAAPGDDPADDGKININMAPLEQLMTLPGIGQSKAESIVSWREEHGDFQQIADIMEITGIKEGVFAKIKDHIKIN